MERERVDDGAVEVEGDGAVGGRKARVERPPRRGRVPVRPVVEVEDQAGLRAAGRGEGVGLPAQGERDRSDGRPVLLQPGQGAGDAADARFRIGLEAAAHHRCLGDGECGDVDEVRQQCGLRVVHADADPAVAVDRLVGGVLGDEPQERAAARQADPCRAVRCGADLHRLLGRGRVVLGGRVVLRGCVLLRCRFQRGPGGSGAAAVPDAEGDRVAVQIEAARRVLPRVLARLQPVQPGDAQHAEGCGECGQALIVPRLPFGGELFHRSLGSSGCGCAVQELGPRRSYCRCHRPGRHPRAPRCENAGCAVRSTCTPDPVPPAVPPRPPGPTAPPPVPLRPGRRR